MTTIVITIGAVVIGSLAFALRRAAAQRDEAAAANAELRVRAVELEQRARDSALLVQLAEVLQLSTNAAEAAGILPAFGARVFARCDGAVYLTEEGQTGLPVLHLAAAWGEEPETTSISAADCRAVRRGTPHTGCIHGSGLFCIPLLARGESLGVLTLRLREGVELTRPAERFAIAFADQVALAIANVRLRETLRAHAVRDALTGLYNRRHMEESLRRELARAANSDANLGVLLIDVDHFKRFNDTHGHGGGDVLLQQFARLMQHFFDENDVVCRYGGEEFVVMLRDASIDRARMRAEELRVAARELAVRTDGRVLDPVTISIGVAVSPLHGKDAATLIAAADRALYTAKSGGRDRIATPPPQVVGRDAA